MKLLFNREEASSEITNALLTHFGKVEVIELPKHQQKHPKIAFNNKTSINTKKTNLRHLPTSQKR